MAVDRYTKIVLTVIAGCLLWLCAVGTPAPLHAQQNMTFQNGNGPAVPVVVVGSGTMRRDGVVTVLFRGNQTDPAIPVALPYSAANPMPTHLTYTAEMPLPIEIASVRKGSGTKWESLQVNVDDAPLRSKPGIGRENR
jgi:hypothetical protein